MTADGHPGEATFARLESREPFSCDVQIRRAGMTEDEFWTDVANVLIGEQRPPLPYEESDDDFEPPRTELDMGPCPECGESGACAYDALGRPLIHPTRVDED